MNRTDIKYNLNLLGITILNLLVIKDTIIIDGLYNNMKLRFVLNPNVFRLNDIRLDIKEDCKFSDYESIFNIWKRENKFNNLINGPT